MKTIGILLLPFLFFQKNAAAQDCKNYAAARPGSEWQISNFNKKGILQSTTNCKLVATKAIDSTGFEALVEQVFLDKKDRETGANNYKFRCQNNKLAIDLPGILPPQILGAYQNMMLDIVGRPVEFPKNMHPGESLPDATVELQAKSGSLIVSKLVFLLTNRLVTGKEEVATAAGVFDCLKIEYDLESRFGAVITKRKIKVWMAENTGMVKTESFKKGKLEGSQQLTFLSKK